MNVQYNYAFQGILYRDSDDWADAIASCWVTADGINSAGFVAKELLYNTDAELANECLREWNLSVSADLLIPAFGRVRKTMALDAG